MMSRNKRDKRFENSDYEGQIEDEEHNAWAVAYGDVVSVLLTFLLLILSISEINPKKFEQVQKQMKNEEEPIEVDQIFTALNQIIEKEGMSYYVDVQATSTGVSVSIADKMLFESGEGKLKQENIRALVSIIDMFKELPNEYRFLIEGHTDDVPINNQQYPSNWHLSADRALSVLEIFKQKGFSEKRFSVEGKADTAPLVEIFDERGNVIPGNREKNRRVLIKVR